MGPFSLFTGNQLVPAKKTHLHLALLPDIKAQWHCAPSHGREGAAVNQGGRAAQCARSSITGKLLPAGRKDLTDPLVPPILGEGCCYRPQRPTVPCTLSHSRKGTAAYQEGEALYALPSGGEDTAVCQGGLTASNALPHHGKGAATGHKSQAMYLSAHSPSLGKALLLAKEAARHSARAPLSQ